jgi:ubiquinone/menaquinone biosynthesis C-methylase UbiE
MDMIDTYNRTAEAYAKSRVGTEDKDALAQLSHLLPPKARVLDVGCAAGRDAKILKDIGFTVTGIDLAEKLLDIARKSYPDITFILADMRKLPFEDESFDAVWASAVLHHITKNEMPGALQEIRRVLVPGGVLYVHTKAGTGVLTTKEAIVADEEREFTLLTTTELDTMLTNGGYTKLSLELKESRSRKGLLWLNGFYRKVA